MANQRKKNDIATEDRRDLEDKTRIENRIKNDEMTGERRHQEDRTRSENRLKNDQMTVQRRRMNDRNPWRTVAISLLILAILATGAYYYFFLR